MGHAENRTPTARTYFESLDLVRGLAAILVLVYHVDFMFGLRGSLLQGGYLAVDLFFVLSGFVLSHTYGERVAGRQVGFRDYLTARLARLYPLFLLTTVVGFAVMTTRFVSNHGYLDTGALLRAGLANLVMLPTFSAPYGMETLFPFNGATWSIFFEMVASLLFFLVMGRLSTRWLLALTLAMALWLGAEILRFSTVDLGWGSSNFAAGFPRALFSFGVGMLIHRAFVRRRWRFRPWALYALLLAALALVQMRTMFAGPSLALFDAAMLALVLPAIVAVGAGTPLSGRAALVARVLGEASYSVYLLQGSLIILAAGVSQALTGAKIYDLGVWVGFAFVAGTVATSFVTFHLFENPARIALRRLAGPRGARGRKDAVSVSR